MENILEEKNVIVVYGGSFNPILYSHLSIAEQVVNQFKQVKKVMFVPVSTQYEKAGLIENKHRYEMIKLAISGNENFLVSDIELKNKEQLHTFQTLQKLQKQYINHELWFMMGADNLKEINTWSYVEELFKNYKIVIIERDDDQLEDIIQKNELLKKYQNHLQKLEISITKNMSASYVRQKIKNKESITGFLPPEVEEYIIKNNLYR